ncbi:MAG: threonylcarbamoyl-AMP synthase [Candidatus Aenigmarchaeota archaeon]|nr:threonylcarbamoyl-AMP synthase [Candidatus Aenigmarchaeota archaeon]
MCTVKLDDVLNDHSLRKSVVSDMRAGKVFVYPTDTIYGIGCNAENAQSVSRVREAKGRDSGNPFSVIAPSKEWIKKHTGVSDVNMKLISSMLPGPYTMIVPSVHSTPNPVVSGEKTIGIRMPRHPFSDLVSEAGVPFVTTSVNASGEMPITDVTCIPEEMKPFIDWIIDAGKISGSASRIFDMRSNDIKVVKRR